MSLPYAITAIGDAVVLQYPFMEQVSGLSGAGIEVGGTSATRTYVAEFRWSTDGVTWTSWLAFTTPMLAAQVLDPDNRFYMEIRVTRTGTDNTGVLTWTYATFSTTIDSQAVSGHGKITQLNIFGDTKAAFVAIIQSWVWQVTGGDHYIVAYKHRDAVYNVTKPTIYLHGLEFTDTDALSTCVMRKNGQISIGMKPVANKTTGYDEQISRLLTVFDPFNYGRAAWNFTFKGVVFVDTPLPTFGLIINSVSGLQEFYDTASEQFHHEFTVGFSIDFSKFA